MKRFTLLALGLFGLLQTTTYAQATKDAVILEIATGTWCVYCPGSAMAADDLFDNGAKVGIVEHHNGDVYTTTASDGRNNYYNVQGFPTANFDGANPLVGGSNTTSLYLSYLPRYNSALATPTPFAINASWAQNGANIDIVVGVDQVGAYTGGALRLQAALTESNILVNWQGQTKCDFVNRAMQNDHHGIPLTTSQGGPTVNNSFSMAISPAWNQQEMQLVVWVEDSLTQEIFNGKMMTLSTASNPVDVQVLQISNSIAVQSCITSIAPEFTIRNMGGNDLNAATISYDVNGVTPMTYNWTGNVPYFAFENIVLPSISFVPQATNTLTITMTVAGDASTGNDMTTKTWNGASLHPAGEYTLLIKPDNYGSETTWDVKSSNGTVIASGGPYIDGNRLLRTLPFTVGINDCFTLNMYDEYGDGICCDAGNGYYRLLAPNGDTIHQGGNYGAGESLDWKTDGTVNNLPQIEEEISVSPNPSNGQFTLRFASAHPEGAQVTVWSSNGQQVFSTKTAEKDLRFDLSDLSSGVYLMRVVTDQGAVMKKLQKN